MRETKKIALSALMCALAVSLMALGAVIDTLDLTIAALASLCLVFIYLEIGSPYTWISWLVTSLLSFLLFPQSFVWAEFLFLFGLYPMLKGYVERLPLAFWWPAKILLFLALFGALVGFVQWLLGISFFDGETRWENWLLFGLCLFAFVAYDLFITVIVRLYFLKYRDKIKKYLK